MKWFTASEFGRCTPVCNISQMDVSFLGLLDSARELSGVPFRLLSCFRSSEYDRKKGRSGKGYHTLGRAADVKCNDGVSRRKIVAACLQLGLSVGVYPSFLHIDNRENQIIFYGK